MRPRYPAWFAGLGGALVEGYVVAEWDWVGQAWKRLRRRRSKADAVLLTPREVRIRSKLASREYLFAGLLFASAITALKWEDGFPSGPYVLLGMVLLLAAAVALRRAYREADEPNPKRDTTWEPYRDNELRYVAADLDGIGMTKEIRLLHVSGEGASLLPKSKNGALLITKRFWTELSPGEQRCALLFVIGGAGQSALTSTYTSIGLAMLMMGFAVVFVVRSPDTVLLNLYSFVVAVIMLVIARASYRSYRSAWRNAAEAAGDLTAPITLLQKLIEEEPNPKRLALLKSELERYRASLPEGARLPPPATQTSDEQSSSVEVRGG